MLTVAVTYVLEYTQGTRIKVCCYKKIPYVGKIFRTRPDHTGAHPASYTMGIGSFPGVKRAERDVDKPPHLAPRLKEE